jgi:exodeoxyribonuclease VII large subunit
MSEIIAGRKTYTLLDLAESIQRMFSSHFNRTYWVKAEMNKLNHYNQSGHCYPELLQKENGKTVAEFKSILWKNDYDRVNRLFIDQIKEPLKNGIKVLCEVSVSYSPQYGLSLRIHDIDISYTLGDIEAEKKATIERLKREGLFHLNKTKQHAILPKRIAVISVESSKGFADFQEIIDAQGERFSVFRMLFPALLQGDKAVESILAALHRVRGMSQHFDAVAIIRGGGGDVGLSCFNHYELARAIADFPLPVYTGIGHSTNETVCELVSFYNGITPTKVAQQLLDQFERFEYVVLESQRIIVDRSHEILTAEHRELNMHSRIIQQAAIGMLINNRQRLAHSMSELTKAADRFLANNNSQLQTLVQRIPTESRYRINSASERIEQLQRQLLLSSSYFLTQTVSNVNHLERIVTLTNPQNILRKGYSITYVNGLAVRDTAQLKLGDSVTTILDSGRFESEVKTIQSS